jgi:hypothetical protein
VATNFLLFGATDAEFLHVFVMFYFGFGELAVFLYEHGYRKPRETQAEYDGG